MSSERDGPSAPLGATGEELFAAAELAAPGVVESDAPPPPAEPVLDPDDPRTVLQRRLRTVLAGLPAHFEFHNTISGVDATDLHSLNTLLGTSIETQVVRALNQQRKLWDPDDSWLGFTFERQAQRFPDVRLVRKGGEHGVEIALGIELKGWFLLSKEGEPSFRFATTPAACAPHDLLVVVPWHLDSVLSGSPVAAPPYAVSASWAARYRNYYWRFARAERGPGASDRSITSPPGARPYPGREAAIADVPTYDGGKNFGRVARVPGLMDEFITGCHQLEVLGIRIGDWYRFLRMHSDQADPDEVTARLERDLARHLASRSTADATEALSTVVRLGRLLG